ncbi:MAG: phage head closure protein [Prevotella sp.]|jgi:SPP1 family predicted phage head-tail adaptor|nr:phage head closure protein [Prevotella sp.]
MRAGLLKDTITIQRKVEIETEYAGKKTEYQDCITTRAEVVHNSGTKRIEAGEIFTSYTVRFSIYIHHKITPDMVIIHDGIKYRILDVNPQKAQQRIIITGEIINE